MTIIRGYSLFLSNPLLIHLEHKTRSLILYRKNSYQCTINGRSSKLHIIVDCITIVRVCCAYSSREDYTRKRRIHKILHRTREKRFASSRYCRGLSLLRETVSSVQNADGQNDSRRNNREIRAFSVPTLLSQSHEYVWSLSFAAGNFGSRYMERSSFWDKPMNGSSYHAWVTADFVRLAGARSFRTETKLCLSQRRKRRGGTAIISPTFTTLVPPIVEQSMRTK